MGRNRPDGALKFDVTPPSTKGTIRVLASRAFPETMPQKGYTRQAS